MFSKNSFKHTKLAISKNKLLALVIILNCFFSSANATKLVGDPKLKVEGLVSKVYDEAYTISRDNTLDFIYTYKDGTEKSFGGIPVFPNGNMVLPGIGEEHVFGFTIDEVQKLILERNPQVAKVEIFVKRVANNFAVLGEVNAPGSFKLADIRTIYDGIAKAKGFTDVARKGHVQLIRQREDGSRYSYIIDFPKEVFQAYGKGSGIGVDAYILKEGDLIYVPSSTPRKIWKIFKQAASAATLGVFAGVIGSTLD